MISIECGSWKVDSLLSETAVGCKSAKNLVDVVELGLESDSTNHDGFTDEHSALSFGAAGRTGVRARSEKQIVFRWKIDGWEFVEEAALWIFRWGSDRPVGYETIRSGEGKREMFGTVAGIRLTTKDEELMPQGIFTAAAGPYMARLHVKRVKEGTKVNNGARRTYFDVLPVVIVGAGAAGLSAAHTLLRENESVILVEARDRVGGRAWTVQSKGNHDIDLGCQWLHEANENPWGLVATRGVYPHDQTAVTIIKGNVVKENPFDAYIEAALKECGKNESVAAAAKRVARKKAEEELIKGKKGAIDDAVEEAVKKQVELQMASYDPKADSETAKSEFMKLLEKEIKLVVARNKEAKLRVDLGKWKEDNNFLSAMTASKRTKVTKEFDRASIRSPITKKLLEESASTLEANAGNLLKDPLYCLALGVECELEESIGADQFNSVERTSSESGGNEEEDNSDAEEQKEEVNDGYAAFAAPEANVPETGLVAMNYLPVGGYGTLLADFAKSLTRDYGGLFRLQLKLPVKEIKVDGWALVDCETKVFPAAAVIITIPTAVMNAGLIKFTPKLPKTIVDAFSDLPMGHYKKIILQLKNDSKAVQLLDEIAKAIKEQKDEIVRDLTLFSWCTDTAWKFLFRRKERLIVAFVGGAMALSLDQLELDKVQKTAVGALAEALKLDASVVEEAVEEALTSRWSNEPYSRGAYSYTKPGGVGKRRLLRGAVAHGRIAFAGEALWYESYGTAHGASLSGQVAAKLVRTRIAD